MARGQILFDHLWGIPGGARPGGNDLALLRSLNGRGGESAHAAAATAAAPYVLLDQRDIAENRDNCCNHSFGRAAREYAWHSQGLHGLKYTVFDRDRLPARVCWGVLVVALFVAAVCVSAGASRFLLSSPSVYVAVDKVGRNIMTRFLPYIRQDRLKFFHHNFIHPKVINTSTKIQ